LHDFGVILASSTTGCLLSRQKSGKGEGQLAAGRVPLGVVSLPPNVAAGDFFGIEHQFVPFSVGRDFQSFYAGVFGRCCPPIEC